LHVFLSGDDVAWTVTDQAPPLDGKKAESVGAPPIILRWPTTGDSLMDRTVLATARIGREFKTLYVNEGLYVYCRGVSIWWFFGIRDSERHRPILYISEVD
jgi:hypothetical protein